MLATTQYLDENRLDDFQKEEALVPHENKCRPVGREKLAERVFVPAKDFEELATYEPNVLSGVCSEEMCHRLLNLLSADERAVVVGYFFDDCSLEEFAKLGGLDICLVRRIMISALKKMRSKGEEIRGRLVN